jgi:phosphate transport system substrate-binding protein
LHIVLFDTIVESLVRGVKMGGTGRFDVWTRDDVEDMVVAYLINRRAMICGAIGLSCAAASPAWAAETIGTGSNLIAPILQKWTDAARTQSGIDVTYRPTGSADGQNKVLAREVDFAMVGLPLSPALQSSGNVLQFPMIFAGIALVVNLPGIESNQLRLTADLLVDIYGGTLRKWTDPRIAAMNPGLRLPDVNIHPVAQVYNSPDSGYVVFNYLVARNAAFRAKFGTVMPRRWTVGSLVESNPMMGEVVRTLPGAIGYMGHPVAVKYKMPLVRLLNESGQFISLDTKGVAAKVDAIDWAKSPDLLLNMAEHPDTDQSWPLVTTNYAILPYDPKDPARNREVLRLFDFALTKGRDIAAAENYVVLPKQAEGAVRALWTKLIT